MALEDTQDIQEVGIGGQVVDEVVLESEIEEEPIVSTSDLVLLKTVAAEVGHNRSTLLRKAKALGFAIYSARDITTCGQEASAVTYEDADKLRAWYLGERVVGQSGTATQSSKGAFYGIQVAPDLKGTRIKFGFSPEVDGRLAAYRTVSPTAKVWATFPCDHRWVGAAISVATRKCVDLGADVYDVDSLDSLRERIEQFFALMPEP